MLLSLISIVCAGYAIENKDINNIELVVTASRYSAVQPNSTVLTEQDLERFINVNIPSVLESVPGIVVKRNGGKNSNSSLLIQGTNSNQTLVLLNGLPIKNSIYSTVDFTNLDLENISRIEIYRGGMSAVYGSDAVGGVVNLITKTASDQTTLKVKYASFNDRSFTLSHSQDLDSFRYRLNYSAGLYDGFRTFDHFNNNNFSGDLSYDIDQDSTFDLYISTYCSTKGNPGPSPASVFAPPSEQRDEGQFIQEKLTIKGDNGDKVTIYFAQNADSTKAFNGASYAYDSKSYTAGYQHELSFGNQALVFGLENYLGQPNDSTLSRKDPVQNMAYFINDEFQLTPYWKLNVGGRLDQHSSFGQASTYKMSTGVNIANNHTIKASIGSAFRAPTISDLYYADPWSSGNPNLTPEFTQMLDLEYGWQIIPQVKFRASIFQNNVRDLIQWAMLPNFTWTPQNIGKAKFTGLEVELNSEIHKILQSNTNISYLLEAINEDNKQWLMYRPKYKIANLTDVKTPIGNFGLKTIYTAERTTEKTGVTLPSYLTMDLNYSWQLLTVYMHNVFDYSYEESYQYPMPRRTFGVELRYSI